MSVFKRVLGLIFALPIIQCLEKFNRVLQGLSMSIPGMMAAADVVKKELQHLRSDEVVKNMLASAELKVEDLGLDPFVERHRKTCTKYSSGTQEYVARPSEDLWRVEFFRVIDSAMCNLNEYFTSTDLMKQNKLTSMLRKGVFHQELVDGYPELNKTLLHELDLFRKPTVNY